MAQNIITQIIIEALYKDKASGPARETEKKLQAIFKNIGTLLGISFGVYGIKQLINYTKRLINFEVETARLTGQTDNLRQSFLNLTKAQNLNAELMLSKMQKASHNTILSTELMNQANNALLLGLPITEEEMGLLTEAGYKLGKAMGVDAAKGLESLTVGIGRQSRLWLDNLGIVIDAEAGNKKYAESLGKTVGQLTEAERKTAFYNSAIEQIRVKLNQLGPIQENQVDILDRAAVEAKEASIAYGKFMAPAISQVASLLALGAKNVKEFFLQLTESDIETTIRQLKELGVSAESIMRLERIKLSLELREINKELDKSKFQYKDIESANRGIEYLEKRINANIQERADLEQRRFEVEEAYQKIKDTGTLNENNQARHNFNLFIDRMRIRFAENEKQRNSLLQEQNLIAQNITLLNKQTKTEQDINFINDQLNKGKTDTVTITNEQIKTEDKILERLKSQKYTIDDIIDSYEKYMKSVHPILREWKELATIEKPKTDYDFFSEPQIAQLVAVSNLFETFSSNISQAVIYSQKLGPAMVASLKAIAAQLAAKILLYGLAALFTGGTSATAGLLTGGKATSFLGYLFGGAFAEGGNPPTGKPYLVGEHGPELRIDRTPGTIIPNNIFNFKDTSTAEIKALRGEVRDLTRTIQLLKFSVQIGDKEIYASNERVAASRRRIGL